MVDGADPRGLSRADFVARFYKGARMRNLNGANAYHRPYLIARQVASSYGFPKLATIRRAITGAL